MENMTVFTVPVGAMRVNCYILRDAATGFGAIVDPGGENDFAKIISKCETESVDVKLILLTHAHFDHMLSLERVREATGAPLCLHSCDSAALADPNISYMAQFAGVHTPCKPAERLLSDGDTLEIGGSVLTVLHTPGHTPGSVCYKADGFILTGDTLFRGSAGRCDLFGGDNIAMAQSLEKLKRLGAGDYKLYPGHGGETALSRELRENMFLK